MAIGREHRQQPDHGPDRQGSRAQHTRRHRPEAPAGGTGATGVPRFPHRLVEPRRVPRPRRSCARSCRAHGESVAVFLLDLDGFKTVNDSLGHDAGDQLLSRSAQRLQFEGRSSDTVARIGGDEFGILLEDDADETSARAMADRLLAAFSVPFEVRGREVFVRATIGIALSVAGAVEHRRDDPERGHRDVRREGRRQGTLRVLPPVHARACPRALRGAGRPRGRPDPPRVRRALPADRRLRDREGAERRGARALEPSDPRAARAPRVHPHRRRHGGHRSAGSLGARPGVPTDRRVARSSIRRRPTSASASTSARGSCWSPTSSHGSARSSRRASWNRRRSRWS